MTRRFSRRSFLKGGSLAAGSTLCGGFSILEGGEPPSEKINVGIIGAGLIVFSRGRLHNLTTAAHLWLTAVIGIACGAGQWPLVLIGTFVSLIMMTLLRIVEHRVFGEDRNLGSSDDSR